MRRLRVRKARVPLQCRILGHNMAYPPFSFGHGHCLHCGWRD